jgi:hypothetical protein
MSPHVHNNQTLPWEKKINGFSPAAPLSTAIRRRRRRRRRVHHQCSEPSAEAWATHLSFGFISAPLLPEGGLLCALETLQLLSAQRGFRQGQVTLSRPALEQLGVLLFRLATTAQHITAHPHHTTPQHSTESRACMPLRASHRGEYYYRSKYYYRS